MTRKMQSCARIPSITIACLSSQKNPTIEPKEMLLFYFTKSYHSIFHSSNCNSEHDTEMRIMCAKPFYYHNLSFFKGVR